MEETPEEPKKEKKKKERKAGKIIAYAVVFLILGCVVTALSAILPKLPYTFTQTKQLNAVDYGFPLGFAEQKRSDDEVTALINEDFNKNVNKGLLLPRYDLYETDWNIGLLIADVFINGVDSGNRGCSSRSFPRIAKKSLKFAVFGLLVCLLFCPVARMARNIHGGRTRTHALRFSAQIS